MYIIDLNFTKPYELIEEILPDTFPGGKFLWKGYGENVWMVEKIAVVKFKGDKNTTDIVYLIGYEDSAKRDFVDGLSFINGYTPVGTIEEGIKENFFENLCRRSTS